MDYTLLDAQTVLRAIGRGVVFYAEIAGQPGYWDGTTDLALKHLGDTEGDISIAMNESFVHLTTPEQSGAGKRKSYVEGADPVVTIPLYVADPALRAIVSPTGSASKGYARRRPVTELTLVIFPEELFLDVSDNAYKTLSWNPATQQFEVGGQALTAAQTALLGQAVWLWRGYFVSPSIVLKHGDAGKAVESCTFQVMMDDTKPDGAMLLTIGDPADAGIDINPTAS